MILHYKYYHKDTNVVILLYTYCQSSKRFNKAECIVSKNIIDVNIVPINDKKMAGKSKKNKIK